MTAFFFFKLLTRASLNFPELKIKQVERYSTATRCLAGPLILVVSLHGCFRGLSGRALEAKEPESKYPGWSPQGCWRARETLQLEPSYARTAARQAAPGQRGRREH